MPHSVTPSQIYDAIEASTLDAVSVDIRDPSLRLEIHVLDDGVTTPHVLSFKGVSRLRLDRPSTAAWEYVELSETVLEPSKETPGQWRFWAELWSKDTIEITAQRVLFDGSEVHQGAA